jgi:hypothetical protein
MPDVNYTRTLLERLRHHTEALFGEAKSVDDYPWKLQTTAGGKTYSTEKLSIGKLGRVSYQQAKQHEDEGSKEHKWSFDSQSGGPGKPGSDRSVITVMRCLVCGALRKEDRKGRPIYK